jgi:hypothetical protein
MPAGAAPERHKARVRVSGRGRSAGQRRVRVPWRLGRASGLCFDIARSSRAAGQPNRRGNRATRLLAQAGKRLNRGQLDLVNRQAIFVSSVLRGHEGIMSAQKPNVYKMIVIINNDRISKTCCAPLSLDPRKRLSRTP